MFERMLLRAGLIDRLKLQTLGLRNRIAPAFAPELPAGGGAAWTRSIRTRPCNSTGI
jgi:hypothetical protein